MNKILGIMATFPQREEVLKKTLPAICKQVHILKLVLNEFSEVPLWLSEYGNVEPILPPEDLKDVGKFYPERDADWIVMFDDDILYPDDYVSKSLNSIGDLAGVFGYHGTI